MSSAQYTFIYATMPMHDSAVMVGPRDGARGILALQAAVPPLDKTPGNGRGPRREEGGERMEKTGGGRGQMGDGLRGGTMGVR